MNRIVGLGAVILFLSVEPVLSQVNDAGMWLSTSVSAELTKTLDAEGAVEGRFNDNFGELATSFADISLALKIMRNVQVGVNYRTGTRRNIDNTYGMRQRVAVDLGLGRYELRKFDFRFRLRYQFNNAGFGAGEDDVEFSRTFRAKMSVSRKLMKKTDLRFGGELFFRGFAGTWAFSDLRTGLELRRRINKRQDLSLGYLFQTELGAANPERDFVILLGYSWALKGRNYKEKLNHPTTTSEGQ
jgi:hypothetical protein